MSDRHAILIVSGDKEMRDVLTEQLSRHPEFEVTQAVSATQTENILRAGQVDVIAFDTQLSDGENMTNLTRLRDSNIRTPIVVLAAREEEGLQALEAGANDYVTKPFRFVALLARIRSQIRQYEASEDAVFPLGPFSFRPISKVLVAPGGKRVKLTEKETSILRYLYRQCRRPVARNILLEEVWGYNSDVSTHTLETHIYRLRQKIETDPSNATLLITEDGGYKLVP